MLTRIVSVFSATMALALAAVAAAAPVSSAANPEPAPVKPSVHLSAGPRNGFRPLTVTLTGKLTGVDETDPMYCHAGVEWESRTPQELTTISKEDPRCLHPPEEVHVQTTFTKIVTLSRPGTYIYRLILHRRDGEKIQSNTQEIRVLDNR